MDLLILLASRQGELVTREEVIERLWGKGVHFDVDQGINTAIRKIRQCLRDTPENPTYIQTVVGKGYRFIPHVHISQPATTAPEAESAPKIEVAEPQIPASQTSRFRGKKWMIISAVSITAAAAGLA